MKEHEHHLETFYSLINDFNEFHSWDLSFYV